MGNAVPIGIPCRDVDPPEGPSSRISGDWSRESGADSGSSPKCSVNFECARLIVPVDRLNGRGWTDDDAVGAEDCVGIFEKDSRDTWDG